MPVSESGSVSCSSSEKNTHLTAPIQLVRSLIQVLSTHNVPQFSPLWVSDMGDPIRITCCTPTRQPTLATAFCHIPHSSILMVQTSPILIPHPYRFKICYTGVFKFVNLDFDLSRSLILMPLFRPFVVGSYKSG